MKYRFREVSIKNEGAVDIPDTAKHVNVYVDDEVSIVSWLEEIGAKGGKK